MARTVRRNELRKGMVVKTPEYVEDAELGRVSVARVMPNPPAELVVDRWDDESGDTELRDPRSRRHLAYNQMDYPRHFDVVDEGKGAAQRAKARAQREDNGPKLVGGRLVR